MANDSTILDISLAAEGERKIEWVAQHAHTMNALAKSHLSDGALKGRRIALAIHLEAKTAYLAWLLHEAGAEVTVTGSNPNSTQDAVAAALVKRGLCVHAIRGADADTFDRHLLATLDSSQPELVIDDGAELITRLHQQRPKLLADVRAGSEETTSGVIRLRAMEQEGALKFPVIAANDAQCKHLFDNRYGTGQSTIAAIMSLTNLFLAGKRVVVAGYGWSGRGVALYARGQNARVAVVETDAIKALEAHADGFDVLSLEEAAPVGDIFITVTGSIGVLRREHFERMKDGALLANAGNYAHEIDVAALKEMAKEEKEVRHLITEFVLADGRRLHLLARGDLVNIAGADGHPVEIMDLSFSVQALSVHYLAQHAEELAIGVHDLPEDIDRAIARTRLEQLGVKLEKMTPEQEAYLKSWR
jgi:adenosylhomocysteinase